MGKLYRPLTQRLLDAGCRLERQGKGSHEIWYSPVSKRTFSVPLMPSSNKRACQRRSEGRDDSHQPTDSPSSGNEMS
jgi:hypothetical protein